MRTIFQRERLCQEHYGVKYPDVLPILKTWIQSHSWQVVTCNKGRKVKIVPSLRNGSWMGHIHFTAPLGSLSPMKTLHTVIHRLLFPNSLQFNISTFFISSNSLLKIFPCANIFHHYYSRIEQLLQWCDCQPNKQNSSLNVLSFASQILYHPVLNSGGHTN